MDKLVFKSDIDKEIAEMLGKDVKVIEAITAHSIKYMKAIIEEDDEVLAFKVPNLGTLRFSNQLGKEIVKKSSVTKKRLSLLRSLISKPFYKKSFKRPLVFYLKDTYKIPLTKRITHYYTIVKELAFRNNMKNNEIYK